MARSIHIKDESRFPGKWAFVGFGDGNTGKTVPEGSGVLFLPRTTCSG